MFTSQFFNLGTRKIRLDYSITTTTTTRETKAKSSSNINQNYYTDYNLSLFSMKVEILMLFRDEN